MAAKRVEDGERARAIMASAAKLFEAKGVAAVSVDEIVSGAGIAKGTFYLYFRTKTDLLARMAQTLVETMVAAAAGAGQGQASALDRLASAILSMQQVDRSAAYLVEALNHPDNSSLHDLVNMELVRRAAPVLAEIVEAGRNEGVFDLDDALPTLEFLLAGQAALLGGGRFGWTPEEHARRLRTTIFIIERAWAPGRTASPPGLAR